MSSSCRSDSLTSQIRRPTSISWRDQLSYAVRFTLCLLTMETVLHTMYVVAIKDSAAWEGDSPAEMSMIGFWNLVVVWLKVGDHLCVGGLWLTQTAPHTLAVLPAVGSSGRCRPPGEHDSLRCQQLLYAGFLAFVA